MSSNYRQHSRKDHFVWFAYFAQLLTGFSKAAIKRDLQPMGVVRPSEEC
jgi:hypothetical protein